MSEAFRRPSPEGLLLAWTPPRFERLAFAPLWIWLGIAAAWMGVYTVFAFSVLGPVNAGSGAFWRGWGLTCFQDALLIGYLPAAFVWGQRQGQRALVALRPVLRQPESFQSFEREVHGFEGRKMLRLALAATGGALLIGFYNISRLRDVPGLAESLQSRLGLTGSTESFSMMGVVAWEILALVVVASLFFVYVYSEIVSLRRFSSIGARAVLVRLTDLSTLQPFAELGLGAAVRVVGVAVVASVGLLVVPEDTLVIIALVAAPVLAVLALVGPVRGVRRVIEGERQSELSRIRAQVHGLVEADGGAEPGRLADLLAYERRLQSINAWLYDGRVLLRFGIALGAGMSMIGGALVERLLSAILD